MAHSFETTRGISSSFSAAWGALNTGKQLISHPPCGWPAPVDQTKDMPFSCVHNTYSFKEKAQQPLLASEFFGAYAAKNIQKRTGVGFQEYSAE